MNKFEFKQFNETYYEDVCDNGLKIIVCHKPLFKTTACLFGTSFGSFDIKQQTDDGKIFTFQPGIAHFLEHKLFESDKGDVFLDFSTFGANVNAFTSFKETVYYFSSSDENIEKPLNLLLDFVQSLNISEESVEKEKGIIAEELLMYLQNPDTRLYFETFKGMYNKFPLKDDVGGSVESVNCITKNDLETCYKLNYHPSNMLLVIVSDKDPIEIISLIKQNQERKIFDKYSKAVTIFEEEQNEVVDEFKVIDMDINETMCCLGIKLLPMDDDNHTRTTKSWMFNFALEAYFSALNPQYQTWLDEKKISSYFSFEEDLGKGYSYLLFIDHSENPDEFKKFILSELEKFKEVYLNKETLNMLKNRNLGQLLRIFNNPDRMIVNYFRDFHNGVSLIENLNIIKKINEKEIYDFVHNLAFNNNCLTVVKNV